MQQMPRNHLLNNQKKTKIISLHYKSAKGEKPTQSMKCELNQTLYLCSDGWALGARITLKDMTDTGLSNVVHPLCIESCADMPPHLQTNFILQSI